MAGRVPVGSQRTAVAPQMEDTFIQNLRYAADLLSKVFGPSVQWWECRGGSSWRGAPPGGRLLLEGGSSWGGAPPGEGLLLDLNHTPH